MSKGRLAVVIASTLVIAGCLIVIVNNANHLPPSVVMPSTKPATRKPVALSELKVDTTQADGATTVAASSTQASTNPATQCDPAQTAAANDASIAHEIKTPANPTTPSAGVASLLNSVVGNVNEAKNNLLGSQLTSPLQGITGSLSQ